MKRALVIFIWLYLFISCGDKAEIKVKVDSVGNKFDSAAEKLYDSTRERARELKDKIVHKLDAKDSARN